MLQFEEELLRALEMVPEIMDIHNIVDPGNEVPSTLYVPTAEKLGQLMRELDLITGKQVNEQWINATVRHEGQHLDAWKIIGADSTCFGLQIFKDASIASSDLSTLPFLRVVASVKPPLEVASAAVYPIEPSTLDVELVKSYGFDGVEEVAERAIQNNRLGHKHIPVPLSYRTTRSY